MFLRRNQKRRITKEEADAIIEKAKSEEPLELEKGDMLAMVLAAFRVFLPFVLLLGGSMFLVWWFITRIWAS